MKVYGQSLTEYGLIAGLVAIVTLPSLLLIGGNLNQVFGTIFPAPHKQYTAILPTLPHTQSILQITSSAIPTSSTITTSSNLTPIISTKELTTTIQTVGVNGTTSLLANSMITVANQLKTEGKLDESTYNNIIQLANQGQKLAQIEAAIDTAAKAAGDGGGPAFNNTTVQLEGRTYSGPQIVTQISNNSQDIQTFQELQNKVLDSAAQTDPETKALIAQLSNNILNIANASATSGDWIGKDGTAVNSYYSYLYDFPQMITDYATQTQKNSNSICATQDQTTACLQ